MPRAPRTNDAASITPLHESDAALIERVRAGDDAAFERLFHGWYENLVRFALPYVQGDQTVAEDLVHDVLFRVWEQRARWEVRGTLAMYLFGAVRNRCVDHARHRGVERRWHREAAWSVTPEDAGLAFAGRVPPRADEAAELHELDAVIRRAIERLPERCRQVFLLHRTHGLTHAEVAAVMDISQKTVQEQMGRALKALRLAVGPFLGIALTVTERFFR